MNKRKMAVIILMILSITTMAYAYTIYGDLDVKKTIKGKIPSVSTGTFAAPITTNPYALAAADCHGAVLFYGATGQINLPVAVKGMNILVYNTGAYTVDVNPDDSDVIVIDGTANAAGHYVRVPSGAGNFVMLFADAAGTWVTLGAKGTLVAE